jgi:hypothetical protein
MKIKGRQMNSEMIERLELLLIEQAKKRETITYQQVAQQLELKPPHTIHQTTELIELMMRLHAKAGAPQLASIVISKTRGGLPAPGFFMLLQEMGIYNGSLEGEDAHQFHKQEILRCFDAISHLK